MNSTHDQENYISVIGGLRYKITRVHLTYYGTRRYSHNLPFSVTVVVEVVYSHLKAGYANIIRKFSAVPVRMDRITISTSHSSIYRNNREQPQEHGREVRGIRNVARKT